METTYDILQSILSDPSLLSNNKENETLRDYITDESILSIEYNISFFKDIPEDDIEKVLEDFLELIYYYERDIGIYVTDTDGLIRGLSPLLKYDKADKSTKNVIKGIIFKDKKKPAMLKEDDLKLLKHYQEMLSRHFPLQACDYPRVYINGHAKNISSIYDINQSLIKDLEDEEFKIINRQDYYRRVKPSKTTIKKFLKNLQKTYRLKGISIEQKQLADALQSI